MDYLYRLIFLSKNIEAFSGALQNLYQLLPLLNVFSLMFKLMNTEIADEANTEVFIL